MWDYLVVTASNALQAEAYDAQIRLRQQFGLLSRVRHALVAPDLEGKRIGSGGATLNAIRVVLDLERRESQGDAEQILRKLRILIVHAGGDSMRLPAYGPCGKIFVPLPGSRESQLPPTLFDRLVPTFLELPGGMPGRGQIVVAAGDALMYWNVSGLDLQRCGITMLGCRATPQEASRHGVCCIAGDDSIVRYLQKPSEEEQQRAGAIGPSGEAILDIGVMSMDAASAALLMRVFQGGRAQEWSSPGGLDLYREICCALGSAGTPDTYIHSAHAGGSAWPAEELAKFYPGLREISAHARVLPYCRFLHFGSTRQLAESGLVLMEHDQGTRPARSLISLNNIIAGTADVTGSHSWVEGCRISAPLHLAGSNVVVGVDIDRPLDLPREACLDMLTGHSRRGDRVWFTRLYGVHDTFKDSILKGGLFCGEPLLDWISAAGIDPDEVWPETPDASHRTLWNARVFPAEASAGSFQRWLWMYTPTGATAAEKCAYRSADRYSAAEIAVLTDQCAFHSRRLENWDRG